MFHFEGPPLLKGFWCALLLFSFFQKIPSAWTDTDLYISSKVKETLHIFLLSQYELSYLQPQSGSGCPSDPGACVSSSCLGLLDSASSLVWSTASDSGDWASWSQRRSSPSLPSTFGKQCWFVQCLHSFQIISMATHFSLFPPGSFQNRPGGSWAVEGLRRPKSWLTKQQESTNTNFQNFYLKKYLALEFDINVKCRRNRNSNLKWRRAAPTWHQVFYSDCLYVILWLTLCAFLRWFAVNLFHSVHYRPL